MFTVWNVNMLFISQRFKFSHPFFHCWSSGVQPASDRYRGFWGVAFHSHRGVSSGRGRDLYPEQLVSENVPEDGE